MLQLTSSIQPVLIQDAMAMIADRIRGEYREMPGLTLTLAQACRLWSLDLATCSAALAQLTDTGFLCRKGDGGYGRVSDLSIRPRMAKARIPPVETDGPRRAAAES